MSVLASQSRQAKAHSSNFTISPSELSYAVLGQFGVADSKRMRFTQDVLFGLGQLSFSRLFGGSTVVHAIKPLQAILECPQCER